MRICYPIGILALLFGAIFVLIPFISGAAEMADYCQAPPLKSEVSPNIMLTIDVSGSMSWAAYYPESYSDTERDDAYDAGSLYEGYFDPQKSYKLVSGVYEETAATGLPCVKTTCKTWSCSRYNTGSCDAKGTHGCSTSRYACCTAWNTEGDCGLETGNYLNYVNMKRVDLVRWAMTGGRPATCDGSFDGGNCDPEVWANPGNATKVGSVCNNALDVDGDGLADGGCILLADNGTQVKVRWDRVYAGLSFVFAKMPVVPRMGAVFFSGTGIRANKVYLGDFTAANSKTTYNFYNMITAVNSHNPGGGTPTGPAMWDTFNYFAMKPPQYGGFAEQTGTGDKWKNPMYTCQNGGTNCVYLPCTDSFVILMSDGSWNSPSCTIGTAGAGSADPVVPAYQMHQTFKNIASNANTKVRATYGIGLFLGGTGEQSLKNVAMYGSFDTSSKSWPGNLTGYPLATCDMDDCGSGKGSGCTALPPTSTDWDADADNLPDTFFSGQNAQEIKDSIMNAVLDILTHTSAGTAASVLASREGSGASLLQAVYYPKKTFANGTVDWAGNLQNLWYYIDPLFANSNIREDGRDGSGAHDNILNLNTSLSEQKDYITEFYFDSGLQSAMASRWPDTNGDGLIDLPKLAPIKVDTVANLWEAGQLLWGRGFNTRKVYTANVSGTATSSNMIPLNCLPLNCPNSALLAPYLNATDSGGVINSDVASTIMQWTMGLDAPYSGAYVPAFRKRKATIGGITTSWKLGDIIHSTPKISTWQALGDYNVEYSDKTYGPEGVKEVYQSTPVDAKTYMTTSRYKGRGMVYAGSNDGMLHAFRLGLLQSKWTGQGEFEKAQLTNKVCSITKSIYCSSHSQCPTTPVPETCSGSVTLGEEVWAFIPKNALPYLKYLADPNYCHIYSVDLTPAIFDASIAAPAGCAQANSYDCIKQVSSWRTILIGGMRLGGACREPALVSAETCTNCVRTPINDPDNNAKGLGYSSYFALDITDQDNPNLMWEYDGTVRNSDGTYSNKLGFSFSGPAVVRISNTSLGGISGGKLRNGKWLVAFGSGPTGPINKAQKAFMGLSDQNLLMHIFDLAAGPGVDNSNVTIIDTGIANAFSGSITGATWDAGWDRNRLEDIDYSDDVIYVPYTYGAGGLNGGLGRLVTRGRLDPANWEWSNVIVGTGPITAAPDMFQSTKTGELWIFFGTGRYFYDTITGADDANPIKQRQLVGMKERCLNAEKNRFGLSCPNAPIFCASPKDQATCGSLTNVDNISVANSIVSTAANYYGWYIDLDPALPEGSASPNIWGQRVITNPSASKSGIVYYTTFKPRNDPCYKAGTTNIWAVKYDTGGAATGLIKGTAIVQVSTGSIEQIDLSKAFTSKDGRMSEDLPGTPPEGEGLTTIPGASGISKLLFMKER